MGDPNYVYQPLSEARRAKHRAIGLARNGTRPGHHKLYGVQVPDGIYWEVKKLVAKVRDKTDVETAGKFAALLVRNRGLLEQEERKALFLLLAHVV